MSRGSGALVAALQDALLEAEHARDVVTIARALRMAKSGEARAVALEKLFDVVDAFDARGRQ